MRLDEKSIHNLVGAIHDGVADPASWQHVLLRLGDATRSMGAMFIFIDRVHPMKSQYVLGRLDHHLMQASLARHTDAQAGMSTLPDTTFFIELIKTEFYGEILQPQQILQCGCMPLARDRERVLGLSVFRSPKIEPADSKDLRLLAFVAPHFKLAVQIAWRIGTLAVVDAAKTAAQDRLGHCVLLIDADGHVLLANRAAEAIIALRQGLTVVSEGLRTALPADTPRLRTLIADTLRGPAGGTMRLTRPSLVEPFLLLIAGRDRSKDFDKHCGRRWLAGDRPCIGDQPQHRAYASTTHLSRIRRGRSTRSCAGTDARCLSAGRERARCQACGRRKRFCEAFKGGGKNVNAPRDSADPGDTVGPIILYRALP